MKNHFQVKLRKILIFGFIFISTWSIEAQHTLTFESNNPYKPLRWLLLQRLEGGEMYLMQSVDSVSNGKAVLKTKNLPYGEYAVQYDSKNIPGLRFIYAGEDVYIQFDPEKSASPYVVQSETNKIYFNFLRYNKKTIRKLRGFKRKYREKPSEELQSSYRQFKRSYEQHVENLKKNAPNKILKHFIAGKALVLPDSLKSSRQAYVDYALKHYFDHIDLNDTILFQSHILLDRLEEYIFKIPIRGYGPEKSQEYIKRLQFVFDRLNFTPARASFIKSFLVLFSLEDLKAQKYLMELYNKLPAEYKNDYFINRLKNNVMHVRGSDMDIPFLKKKLNLKIAPADYYLFVFYSSECPHCQTQLPVLYDFMKNNPPENKWEVIAVGLEENPEHWNQFIKPFTNWKHAYVSGNDLIALATKYFIEVTPTYFVTDKNFEILEKTGGGKKLYKILNYYMHGKTGEKE